MSRTDAHRPWWVKTEDKSMPTTHTAMVNIVHIHQSAEKKCGGRTNIKLKEIQVCGHGY